MKTLVMGHHENALLDAIMANPGLDLKEIFRRLNMSRAVGMKTYNTYTFQIALKERQEIASHDAMIECKRVMQEEACIAFADIADLKDEKGEWIPPERLPERIRRATNIELKAIRTKDGEYLVTEFKYTLFPKERALERISKHLGLYEKDNLQKKADIYFVSEGDDRIPIAEEIPDAEKIEPIVTIRERPIALIE